MKFTRVRIPTQEEFEAIAINMAGKIIEVCENEIGGTHYVIETGGMTVELPSRGCWSIREEAANER